jgi:hypothetical protein
MAWIDAMLRNGVQSWVTIDRFAAQADRRHHGPVPLRLRRRYVRPADLDRFPEGDELVVLSRATDTVLRSLDAAVHAWATLDGRYCLPFLDRRRDTPELHDPIASRHPSQAQDELRVLLIASHDIWRSRSRCDWLSAAGRVGAPTAPGVVEVAGVQ